MNRICLLLVLSGFIFFSSAKAQDFTLDELLKLRASNLTEFESAVMAKGYELSDVSKEYDQYVTFSKDSHSISFGYVKNDHSEGIDTIVVYRMYNLGEYQALQKQRKEDPAHPNVTHFISDDSYILHMYIDGKVCIHFRTKHFHGNVYEIKVMPDNTEKYIHYASLHGDIDY